MRRVFAALISILLVYMMVSFLAVLEPYGKVDLSRRVSVHYLAKDVNEVEPAEWIEGKVQVPSERKIYGESNLEDGSANVVTSIVVNYRSFDTLGEVTVLLAAAIGIGLVLRGTKRMKYGRNPNFILRVSTGILLPLILMFGTYVFIHGHLSPGGGFPGGTILAAGVLLLYLSNEEFSLKEKVAKFLEGSMGSLYVILGLAGLVTGGAFLYNFLSNGRVGDLFSAGVVPIVYIVIGLKVGSELSGVISEIHREGE
ncbi:Na(+)/H(+) antiporter subunit B [Thermotoga neapolitana]|uniref:Na+/H+ antiporter MnhB subunit-related protein n=1 Tax=Thermotoga neapolitana (strain ATCC 49049 / DSM 4359 / NBRC 107923 / NS-E) TaxID=309803 RepID=B9K9A5_THENN|nr:Na(+)/H(+) antiporter subunit B [Thermotoga neapolitana]ACM23538.1 Na+/H+ antiporter MnhB subunit-related protein precursor [Thermotoga neapolitana DSM 4359]KFZ21166.1 monovalent cation/H+ antiporter subunit B [Thermotoga neapolitana LA10]MDK2786278.1 multicomponent Na+:H+ antiporter subunit [Thermotoga sp.]HBF10577.1 cation:proton antiporter [Thermotoga neapolitana]